MKISPLLLISALVGVACGIASNLSFLAGQWANLILWGIAGIVLGFFTTGRRTIIWAAILFGFCLSVSFLVAGFHGSADKIIAFLVLSLGLSVIGSLGGLVAVFMGSRLKRIVT